MRRGFLFFLVVVMIFPAFSQNQWHNITKTEPVEFSPTLISSFDGESVVEFNLEGFYFNDVNAPVSNSKTISVSRTASISEKGAPDLVQLTAPLIIPDLANMEVEVIETEYYDIQNIEIAPSKGDFSRQIDPATVPYEYGPAYEQNAWYPGKLAELAPPHIFRDFRGTVAMVYPFQYNPVTKVLRVYNKIVVKVKDSKSLAAVENPFNRARATTSIVEDFHYMYKDRYLNYTPNRYTAPIERGRILVICHNAFIPDMMPYVRWKNIIGFPTEIVGINSIGNSAAQIKTYVTNYYNTNGLAYLLIVGDDAQVKTYNYGSTSYSFNYPMYSDNYYGDVSGSDSYHEIIVGRFSATSSAHVQTQVQRTLEYEKATGMATGWQSTGMGIAANEGSGGGHDGGEADYVHMNNIRTRLLAYNYTTVHQDYTGNCPGVTNTTQTQISSRINNGVSVINYCNHGDITLWAVTNYSNTQVNALTNVKKLPFIWSVACLNGQFLNSSDCFAEAWMKATHNTTGEPTGAIGVYMATISQPWQPPMDAQDEFNRVLCELIPGKIRRTFGSISTCGTMHMLDLGPTDQYRLATARTWTIFGDPSIMVRTDDPVAMTVSHATTVSSGVTSLAVNCNVNDAFVTLTNDYAIIGTGTVSGGVANITFPAVYAIDTIHVAVTAYNTIPYEGDVIVTSPSVSLDMMAVGVIEPSSVINCTGVSVTPKVVIGNMGINTVTSCTIYYQLNSNPEQSIAWTGSLSTNAIDTVNLPVFTSTVGTHTYKFRTHAPNGGTDGNTSNDHSEKSFIVQDNPVTADFAANITEFCAAPASVSFTNTSANANTYSWDFGDGTNSTETNPAHDYVNLGVYTVSLIADAGVCGSETKTYTNLILVGAQSPTVADQESCTPTSFTLNATGNGNISWYSDAAGTNLVGTGTAYTTPLLNSTTSYWLSTSIQEVIYGGKLDNSGTGSYFITAGYPHGLIFNCTSPVVLKTVKVYSSQASTRTISLQDSQENVLQSANISIPNGESRITLNFNIPVGTNLKLMGPGAPYLYRDGGTGAPTLPYPYSVGNEISITNNTAAGLEFYYYFYDWEVEKVCESALNEVTAYILETPVASFTMNNVGNTVTFTSTSTGGNLTYNWDFGDGNSSTDANPVHTYAANGLYTIVLTVTNSCDNASCQNQIDLTMTTIQEETLNVEIYPNPAESYCKIICGDIMKSVELTDLQGKLIQSLLPDAKIITLDLQGIAKGIYNVRIVTDEETIVKQIQVK